MTPPETKQFEMGDFIYVFEWYDDGTTVITIKPKDGISIESTPKK